MRQCLSSSPTRKIVSKVAFSIAVLLFTSTQEVQRRLLSRKIARKHYNIYIYIYKCIIHHWAFFCTTFSQVVDTGSIPIILSKRVHIVLLSPADQV